ncbi:hypothetical protein [Morganella morganii]
MDIRCRFGFHKWTVYKKAHKTNMYGHKYITQHFGCLRCGKMKAETQECR